MSVIECKNCGATTNTSVSEWMNGDGKIVRDGRMNMAALHCHARINKKTGKWVKGCGYDKAAQFEREFADNIIGT